MGVESVLGYVLVSKCRWMGMMQGVGPLHGVHVLSVRPTNATASLAFTGANP